MKKNIKKLKKALKVVVKNKNKRAVCLVYLSIVLLGYKIHEVAAYFKLSELKVQSALTHCGVRLNNPKKKGFRDKMHTVARMYRFEEELALMVA
jgi:hypothetical protein